MKVDAVDGGFIDVGDACIGQGILYIAVGIGGVDNVVGDGEAGLPVPTADGGEPPRAGTTEHGTKDVAGDFIEFFGGVTAVGVIVFHPVEGFGLCVGGEFGRIVPEDGGEEDADAGGIGFGGGGEDGVPLLAV